MIKRFLVFSGIEYYPFGGWRDYKGSADTKDDAVNLAIDLLKVNDWVQVVDTEIGEILFPSEWGMKQND